MLKKRMGPLIEMSGPEAPAQRNSEGEGQGDESAGMSLPEKSPTMA
jgi:hypothetical protein